jgi:polyhydroxybutyrate depolymerase
VRQIASGGSQRTVALYIPESFSRSAESPLYFVFHGGGPPSNEEKLRRVRALGFESKVDAHGGVVVYPAAGHPDDDDTLWNDGRPPTSGSDDVAFVADLVGRLDERLGVDRDRVFSTGASNGGMFSYRLACELAGEFSAVAPVIAALPQALQSSCEPSEPISIFGLQGTADPFITYTGGDASHDGETTNPDDEVRPVFEDAGAGGAILSADATRQHWATHSGCEAEPAVQRLEAQTDNARTTVYRYLYRQCEDAIRIAYYAVDCMGHNWPTGLGAEPSNPMLTGWTSEEIDATERIWAFFQGETSEGRAVTHEGSPSFSCSAQ